LKKTLRDYFYVLFGTGFSRSAAFINSIIIARWLGPEEFGRFTVFYVVMILTWEIPQACDHTFIRYAKTSDSVSVKRDFLKSAIFVKILYAILLMCIAYPLSSFLSNYAFHKPDTHHLIIAGMVCGVFISFLMSVAAVFQEKDQFGKYAILPSAFSGSILLILLFLKFTGYMHKLNHTKGLVEIYLVIALLLGTVCIAILLKKTGKLFPLNMNVLRTSYSFGKWILGVTMAYYIFQRIDVFALTRYGIFEDIGIYFVAVQPIMIISLLMGSISGVFLPKAMSAVKSRSALINYAKESVMTISIPIAGIFLLMIIAPYFIRIFYGDQYADAGSVLRILLIGWLFLSFYLPFSFLFYALNDSKTRFILELAKILIALMFLFFLVPPMGMHGAALSISSALILNTILSLSVLQYKLNKKTTIREV
jgi:O-antigen/teichoic acid export membrane protein